MTREEADALLAASEAMGYSKFAAGIRTPSGMRQNQSVMWYASQHTMEGFVDPFFKRFRHLLPQELDGAALHSQLSARFAHYKYEKGQLFNAHTDGSFPCHFVPPSGDSVEVRPGLDSQLTMLLYLNDEEDGVKGGATRLFPFSKDREPVDVAPKKGSALFFRHGFGKGSVLHMGTEVTSETPKYVVRLNPQYEDI